MGSVPGTVAAVAVPLPSTLTKDALDDDTDPGLVVVSSVKNRSLIFWPTLFTWAAVKRLVRSMVTVPAPVVMVADAATASPEDDVAPSAVDSLIVSANVFTEKQKIPTNRSIASFLLI